MIALSPHVDVSAALVDTLIWTAILIAIVLVLRRPVTRAFGSPSAYALWCLPMLRLVLPPLELPAWANPAPAMPVETGTGAPIITEISASAAHASAARAPVADAAPGFWEILASMPLTQIALAVWLGGAAVFLFQRFYAYFTLRGDLMRDARDVGAVKGRRARLAGFARTIRLIETPQTLAPIALGVVEPVIALPQGFMAQTNREARDLALEHELEHHRAGDLLVNMIVQPLFALHWFNPLGRYGWLALRRDQEAACDARVLKNALAARGPEVRAVYAHVIANCAAGPNVALAAPMACPVLGDKSIIHRLRNITMTQDQSSHSALRKAGSRLMLAAAVLAVPLTASITYAESAAQHAPAPPAPQAVTMMAPQIPTPPHSPTPPTPPAPPAISAAAQPAPQAPDAPGAPEALRENASSDTTIITFDPDTGETQTVDIKGPLRVEADEVRVVKVKDAKVIVARDFDKGARDGAKLRRETIKIINKGNTLDEAEIDVIVKELREELSAVDEELREVSVELRSLENEAWWKALAKEGRTRVRLKCNPKTKDVATTIKRDDGTTDVLICQSRVMAKALTSLKQAREQIAQSREMSAKMRREVLKELDGQIASWNSDAR